MTPTQLTPTRRQELIDRALAVRQQAYAPYSRFPVGAAVLTDRGDVFAGCNVENASYGLTICAERNAVFQAVSAGQRQLIAVAVAASRGVTPCGACRQVLAEFADDLPILLIDPDRPSSAVTVTLRELLPRRFLLRDHPEGSTRGNDDSTTHK